MFKTVNIKHLSVNECYTGRRFKTDAYKKFERDMLFLLPNMEVPECRLEVEYVFGMSNENADADNGIKIMNDILQKKYGFNDKRIFKISAEKIIVPKGQEYIKFEIKSYEN